MKKAIKIENLGRNLIFNIPILLFTVLFSFGNTHENNDSTNPNLSITKDSLNLTISIPTTGYSTPNSYPNMKSVWADEFTGTNLNLNKWNFQIGNGCPNLCGWGNNECQYYKQENTMLQDGYLIIEAKKEAVDTYNYTSSRINTQGKFSFHYGRVDVRATLPVGQGIWPAIWMLGDNIETISWPACGEIDIMEMIGGNGREKTIHGSVHWDNNGNYSNFSGDYSIDSGFFNDEFHVFSITWTSQKIKWYVDDIQFHEIDITTTILSEFNNDFHFLINLAVGGNWPGNPDSSTTFPQYLIIDYIRVFQ